MGMISILIFFAIVLLIAAGINGIRGHATDDKVDHIPLDAERGADGLPRSPEDPAQ